jgi:hypothetical protein
VLDRRQAGQWGKLPEATTLRIDPAVDMKTPPKVQVDAMTAGKYFAYGAEVMNLYPAHVTDEPILAQMRRIGFKPGKSFHISKLEQPGDVHHAQEGHCTLKKGTALLPGGTPLPSARRESLERDSDVWLNVNYPQVQTYPIGARSQQEPTP